MGLTYLLLCSHFGPKAKTQEEGLSHLSGNAWRERGEEKPAEKCCQIGLGL